MGPLPKREESFVSVGLVCLFVYPIPAVVASSTWIALPDASSTVNYVYVPCTHLLRDEISSIPNWKDKSKIRLLKSKEPFSIVPVKCSNHCSSNFDICDGRFFRAPG